MVEEKDTWKSDDSPRKGAVYAVGIGPGDITHLTRRAKEVIALSECVVGYTRYLDLIGPLIKDKKVFSTGMTHEVERCRKAIELARMGSAVSVISSGDAGIYGMAGLIFELALADGIKGLKIEVIPGLPAFVGAAALLGAPLIHDFASISLSDLMTDWGRIEERIEAASKADFVMIFYNPKSSKRKEGLSKAIEIVRKYRDPKTPVGLVRNAMRDGQEVTVTSLGGVGDYYDGVDMLSIVLIGNSTTYTGEGFIITPRGYNI